LSSSTHKQYFQLYSAPVEGSEEDRRRADQIAREIENSQQSKFNARLENDDDERDLDKATTEDDFEVQSKRGGGAGGQRGNFSSRNQRNGANGPPLGSRRGDTLKGGQDPTFIHLLLGRGGGTPGRYPTQQHMNSPQNRGMPGNKYEQRPRPTGQELQESFNEFSLKESNPRRDPSQGQTTRTYENKNQSQSNKILLEPRSSASPRGAPADPKSQPSAAARRADGLRGWNQEFNNNYRPEGKVSFYCFSTLFC
ncbi:LsmAD domain protein, partial [Oesophagostomum dentatum]